MKELFIRYHVTSTHGGYTGWDIIKYDPTIQNARHKVLDFLYDIHILDGVTDVDVLAVNTIN